MGRLTPEEQVVTIVRQSEEAGISRADLGIPGLTAQVPPRPRILEKGQDVLIADFEDAEGESE